MSEDQTKLITIGQGKTRARATRLLRRAGSLGLSALEATSRRVQEGAQTHLKPRLEDASRWLMDPEHLEQAQQGLAQLASWGMRLGFDHDPRAGLLFEFVDWIEQEHGRAAVVTCLTQHNPVVDGTLLDLIQTRYMTWPKLDEKVYQRKLEATSRTFLSLLGALAQVEDRQPQPTLRTTEALIERFVSSPSIPERFHPLAHMAAGDLRVLHEYGQKASAPKPSLTKRALDKLGALGATPSEQRAREDQRAPHAQAPSSSRTALTTHRPFQADPHFQFVVNSYTFFMHTYMTRAIIEQLPNLVDWAQRAQKPWEAPDEGEDAPGEPSGEPEGVTIDMT